jgi:hypothetical protein
LLTFWNIKIEVKKKEKISDHYLLFDVFFTQFVCIWLLGVSQYYALHTGVRVPFSQKQSFAQFLGLAQLAKHKSYKHGRVGSWIS